MCKRVSNIEYCFEAGYCNTTRLEHVEQAEEIFFFTTLCKLELHFALILLSDNEFELMAALAFHQNALINRATKACLKASECSTYSFPREYERCISAGKNLFQGWFVFPIVFNGNETL